jgi:hypothetical protein
MADLIFFPIVFEALAVRGASSVFIHSLAMGVGIFNIGQQRLQPVTNPGH